MIEIIPAFFLAYSSIEDIKKREISDWVWLAMVVAGIIFLLAGYTSFFNFTVSITVCTVLALALYHSGMMGGGDGKMLIGLGAMMPHYGNSFIPLFPLTVFTNALLISLAVPVFMLSRNLKDKNIELSPKGMILMFTAYRVSKLKWYDAPLEFEEDGTRKVGIFPKDTGNVKGRIWATPQLPFLVFLFFGFIISLFYGDRPVMMVVLWIIEVLAL